MRIRVTEGGVLQLGLCAVVSMLGISSVEASVPKSHSSPPRNIAVSTPPCSPTSDFIKLSEGAAPLTQEEMGLDPGFCAQWNPEFALRGFRCCAKGSLVSHRVGRRPAQRRLSCPRQRAKNSFCDEMTPEQREYSLLAHDGKLGDMLQLITHELGRQGDQAYCTVNDGFLAWGRRIVPSAANRILIRNPHRCVDFGTDPMVGMLEWVGRQVDRGYKDPMYSGVRLVVGDISAPRGGCLPGKSGRRGHASHTTGQDVDLGFLTVAAKGRSPEQFHKQFQPEVNWWLLKQIFKNPFACVKVIFLDRRHIHQLAKEAYQDPEWRSLRRFIRHARAHQNHMHVRIGDGPGRPGCVADPHPEWETTDLPANEMLEAAGPDQT